jgi:chromosome segregation ATPase
MKKGTIYIYLGLSMILFLISGKVNAQTDKKAAEIKRLETTLATANKNVAKHERSLFVADSLLTKGTEQLNESKAETKAIDAERKTLDKQYATQKKALEKLANSRDKAEATKAKTDMKALDAKYMADSKALDTRLKDATKKSTTGSSNVSKGKTGKKNATDALETSRASLDAAQEKYDIATGTARPEEEGNKKKK